MGLDSKGVFRGSCTRCDCKDFNTQSVRCHCGHPPTHHKAVTQHVQDNFAADEASAIKKTYSKALQSNSAPASTPKGILSAHNKGITLFTLL